MKLLCSPASPFSSKVRMAARYLDIDLTEVRVDTVAGPAVLVDNNPLGKIPTLLTDDGLSVFDSRAIMLHFDRMKGKKLYPSKDSKRTQAQVLEALCDGISDALILIMYERRFRTEEKQHQPWVDRQWEKATRSLTHLHADIPSIGKKLHGGHFALAGMLGYLQLRFEGKWESDFADLAKWVQKFEKQFPDYQALKPQV